MATEDVVPPASVALEPDEPHLAQNGTGVGRAAVSGVLWMTAQKWLVRLSGLATVAILTRLLSPRDFGVVAAASTVVPLVYLLSDMGFSTYVVQLPHASRRTLSTGFWFSVSAGVALCGALVLLAPALGDLFRLPAVVPVLRTMVLSVLFVAVGSIPEALLRRAMRFRALAIQGAVAAVLAQVAAVVVAVAGGGVWALVVQLVTAQAISSVLVWVSARWWPALQFSRSEFVAMTRFGVNVVGVELVALARSWGETAIVAATLGATGLGYLNIAQRLIQVTQDMSAAALVPVSTVVFAQVRTTEARLRTSYLRALQVSYAAVAPLMTFIAVAAPLVVPILFGKEWGPSVPVAQALAVAAVLTLGAMLDHGLFYGVGRPGQWLVYALAVDAATVATTAWTVRFGLSGVAIGFVCVSFVATVVRWVLVGRLVGVTTWSVGRPLATTVVLALGSGAAGEAAFRLVGSLPHVPAAVVVGAVTALVYVVLLRFVTPRVLAELVDVLPARFRRRA